MFRPMTGMVGICLIAVALPANARDNDKIADGPPPAVFQAVLDCKSMADPSARLACYDKAVGALDAARAAKDLVVADRNAVREAKRGLFGLSLPSLKLFGGEKDEEVTQIESKIKTVRRGAEGFVFTLEDGAIWAQTDGIYIADPQAGDTIQIRQAILGSYLGKVNGGVAFRIKRRNP